MEVKIVNNSNNQLPSYANHNDAGMDIRADFSKITGTGDLKGEGIYVSKHNENGTASEVTILSLGRVLVPTGIYTAIPVGYHVDVRPRSGLALKQGLTVLNTPGLIDSGYRGEYGVILINLSGKAQTIKDGERVAQLVLMHSERIDWVEKDIVGQLDATDRGTTGFGDSGKD